MDADDERIDAIRTTLEPYINSEVRNKLEGLDVFVVLDYIAFSIARNLDDYKKLTEELPLSELIKFAMYEGIKNG